MGNLKDECGALCSGALCSGQAAPNEGAPLGAGGQEA